MSAALGLLAALAAASGPAWPEYGNGRFAYSICYPATFAPQRESDDGDGRLFLSADGARLAVWGSNDALAGGLAGSLEEDAARFRREGGRVTYRVAGRNSGVLSGVSGDRIFYLKSLLRRDPAGDQVVTFELTYPRSLASRYAPVAERLSRCFALARRPRP